GSGTLNFNLGHGTTYTSSNAFIDIAAANIQSGVVVLNGTGDSATAMSVANGATLEGIAALTTALTVSGGGIFAPGVPGTKMSITGSMTLQAASIYMVTITGANVSGA